MNPQIAGLMRQAQQMQENMKRLQDELATTEVEGQSGAGLVKVVLTCKFQARRVTIDPSLLGEDRDMLEVVAETEARAMGLSSTSGPMMVAGDMLDVTVVKSSPGD